jgi:hypothetical protein
MMQQTMMAQARQPQTGVFQLGDRFIRLPAQVQGRLRR